MEPKTLDTGDCTVLGFRIENTMGIELVEYKFEREAGLSVVAGPNGSGKSSALTAFWMALAGGRNVTRKPIKDGARTGSVTNYIESAKLGRLVIHRRFWFKSDKKTGEPTDQVTTEVTVKGAKGEKFARPQEIMDQLSNETCIDPVRFDLMSAKDRRELLLSVVDIGFDLGQWEREQGGLIDERKDARTKAETLRARVDGMKRHDDAPESPVDPAEIQAKIEEVEAVKLRCADLQRSAQTAIETAADRQRAIDQLEADIKATREKIAVYGKEIVAMNAQVEKIKADLGGVNLDFPELDDLKRQMVEVGGLNAMVADNERWDQSAKEASQAAEEYQRLDRAVKQREADKVAAFRKAKMPVKGLAVDEKDITFDGIPWDQVNTAQRITIALELQASLKPKLKFISSQYGSAMDGDTLAAVDAFAKANGYKVMVEALTKGDLPGLEIRNGRSVDAIEESDDEPEAGQTTLPLLAEAEGELNV